MSYFPLQIENLNIFYGIWYIGTSLLPFLLQALTVSIQLKTKIFKQNVQYDA